jgi:hypothetical protein
MREEIYIYNSPSVFTSAFTDGHWVLMPAQLCSFSKEEQIISLGKNKSHEEISLAGTVRNFSGPLSLVDVQHCGPF